MRDAFLTYFTGLQHEAVSTAALALFVLLGGYVSSHVIERGKALEAKRFWRLTVRHAATAAFLLGLFVIWRTELQTLLLALGAATAGFLVAFRENWMSLVAFWVRMVKRPYGLDDFIEIDGQRGRVTDITWLTTALAETTSSKEGLMYTGRVVHVPNNRMLLGTLAVESFTGEFYPHTVRLPLPLGANILMAEAFLMSAAEKNCADFYVEAERHMTALRFVSDIDIPTVQPRVCIQLEDHGYATLVLRVVVPAKERGQVEQAIVHDFLRAAASGAAWGARPLE